MTAFAKIPGCVDLDSIADSIDKRLWKKKNQAYATHRR